MLLDRVPGFLELHRADVAQRGMESAMVVERQPVDSLVHGVVRRVVFLAHDHFSICCV
jgi:hypothetical protein